MKWLLIACGLITLACTDETATRRTLQQAGFTDVSITGYSFLECGEGDFSHTGFVAKNANGQRVSGTVCCGLIWQGMHD